MDRANISSIDFSFRLHFELVPNDDRPRPLDVLASRDSSQVSTGYISVLRDVHYLCHTMRHHPVL
jgi:hypothetical protein